MCGLDKIVVDMTALVAELHFPEGECCDMEGAIKFVKRVCRSFYPDVDHIKTYSGSARHTEYKLEGKEWKAYRPGGTRR
jgi:hypothetical protein